MRVDKSSMPNESESFNSYQLSSSFGRGLRVPNQILENCQEGIVNHLLLFITEIRLLDSCHVVHNKLVALNLHN